MSWARGVSHREGRICWRREARDPACVFYSKPSAIAREGPCHELARDINPMYRKQGFRQSLTIWMAKNLVLFAVSYKCIDKLYSSCRSTELFCLEKTFKILESNRHLSGYLCSWVSWWGFVCEIPSQCLGKEQTHAFHVSSGFVSVGSTSVLARSPKVGSHSWTWRWGSTMQRQIPYLSCLGEMGRIGLSWDRHRARD